MLRRLPLLRPTTHHIPPIRTITTVPPKRTKPKSAKRTIKKRLPDLPPAAALPAFPPQPLQSDAAQPASDPDPDTGDDYERAIQEGTFPRTPLAKEIFWNMRRYEGDVLLTRVGMFYESYFTQAAEVAALLGIRCTSKAFTTTTTAGAGKATESKQFPFAGFPISQKDKYFQLLLDAGRSFVVVEEADADASGRGSGGKERFVARRFTAGTLCNESWQVGGGNRYLMGLAFAPSSSRVGLAYIDISTDRAVVGKCVALDELEHELARVAPVEVVVSPGAEGVGVLQALLKGTDIVLSYADASADGLEATAIKLVTTHLSSCLMDDMPVLLPPNHQEQTTTMQIDASTLLGLEIRHSLRQSHTRPQHQPAPTTRSGTLLSVIKRTLTTSGTRLLVHTLTQPSAHLPTITHRHALVHAFLGRPTLREDLRDGLRAQGLKARNGGTGSLGEIVRIVQKFSAAASGRRSRGAGVGNGKDLLDLREKIVGIRGMVDRIREDIAGRGDERLRALVAEHRELAGLVELVDGAVNRGVLDNVEQEEGEERKTGGVWWLKPEFNPTLRGLFAQVQALEEKHRAMETQLQERFNTPTLELKSSPFAPGLFVHVPTKKGNAGLVEKDDRLIPLRANKTAKTYLFGPWTVLGLEIQEMHERITKAQEEAFDDLREQILARQEDLLINAGLLDEMDLTLGFAQAADELRWVRPEMQEEPVLEVIAGRHPTVEYGLMTSSTSPRPFIPNDLHIRPSAPVHIITGPNMGGKSTVLRQAAIISILAQAGSFVPADRATLGVVDAVFSRVGARDDLYMDMSTFMLEMHETAYILTHATSKSLVIMDEIGRGTTYNSGIAIAYATLDHILRNIGCRTLFATHYHELCDILQAESRKGRDRERDVEYWYTDLDESEGRFSYSYRLKRGVNRESHAIKTAQQARMPVSFLETVRRMLDGFEKTGR